MNKKQFKKIMIDILNLIYNIFNKYSITNINIKCILFLNILKGIYSNLDKWTNLFI